MRPIDNNSSVTSLKREPGKSGKKGDKSSPIQDSIEISNTSKAFNKLTNFLNLGKKDRLNIDDLNKEEKQEFLKMLTALIKKGIVGYEILEINGKPEKHYIVNQIGDSRTRNAKIFNKKRYGEYQR